MYKSKNITIKQYTSPNDTGDVWDVLYPKTITSQVLLDNTMQAGLALPQGSTLNDAIALNRQSLATAIGGSILAQAYTGAGHAYTDMVALDIFNNKNNIDSYTGVVFNGSDNGVKVASTSISSNGSINSNNQNNAYNGNFTGREIVGEKAWYDLLTFRPDGYGTITGLQLKTGSSTSTGTPAHMKLGIWVGNDMILETAMGTINHYSDATESPANYTVNQAIEPGVTYKMKVWIEDKTMYSAIFSYVKFTITPQPYTSGSFVEKPITMPNGTSHAVLLVHGNNKTPGVDVKYDAGDYTSLTLSTSATDQLPNNVSSTLYKYIFDVDSGSQTIQLKFALTEAGSIIYNFALIFT